MKKMVVVCIVAAMLASCAQKKEEPVVESKPIAEKPYQPVHNSTVVDLKSAKKYTYFNAPTQTAATAVNVDYNAKAPYASPIIVKYSYANGDSYTYTIPSEFGLWKNEAGNFRIVSDKACTVWLQGQTKNGKFHEFVFYGDPKYNGKKIKPNSYKNIIRYK